MNSFLYILMGLVIIFVSYLIVVGTLTALFFWVSHEDVDTAKNLKISSMLAGTGLLVTILSMVAFSSLHIYYFAGLMFLLNFVVYYSTLHLFWKFSNFDAIVISVTLGIILNPAWLRLIGML